MDNIINPITIAGGLIMAYLFYNDDSNTIKTKETNKNQTILSDTSPNFFEEKKQQLKEQQKKQQLKEQQVKNQQLKEAPSSSEKLNEQKGGNDFSDENLERDLKKIFNLD